MKHTANVVLFLILLWYITYLVLSLFYYSSRYYFGREDIDARTGLD